jgi:addiction module RelE/StbE family toxin
VARELIILPRFKRDFRTARKHPEFDAQTLEYVFELLLSGSKLPDAFREHRLTKGRSNLAGFTECQLGTDLRKRLINRRAERRPGLISAAKRQTALA